MNAINWLVNSDLLEAFYYFYLVLCLLASYCLTQALPKRFRTTFYLNFALFFLLSASLFLLGLSAIIVLYLVLERLKPIRKERSLFQASEIPDYQRSPNKKSTVYGEGGGPSILQNISFSAQDKKRVMIAINQFQTASVNELNKLMLKDTADEVRLYAHTLIEKQERALFKLQYYFNKLLVYEKNPIKKAILHKHIAGVLWERVYSSLVNKEGVISILDNIKYHAELAFTELHDDASIPLLMTSIALRENEINKANYWLAIAESNGSSYYSIALFRAEIAFRDRNFSEVTRLLTLLKSKGVVGAESIIQFWSKA